MNVPIEIVRRGKAEEYVRLEEESRIAYRKVEDAFEAHKKSVRSIYEAVVLSGNRSRSTVDAYYLGKENAWKHALMVEELSKELVENAGKLADALAEEARVKSDLKAFKEAE